MVSPPSATTSVAMRHGRELEFRGQVPPQRCGELVHRIEVVDERLPDGVLDLARAPGGLAVAGEGVDHSGLAGGAQGSGGHRLHGTGEHASAAADHVGCPDEWGSRRLHRRARD